MNINRKTLVCILLSGAIILASITGAGPDAGQGQKADAA